MDNAAVSFLVILKVPPLTDDGVVVDQAVECVPYRLTAHQHHTGGIQVPDFHGQPELHADQWVVRLGAKALPYLPLQFQADSFLRGKAIAQRIRQGKPQLFCRLADGLGKTHCDSGAVGHGMAVLI